MPDVVVTVPKALWPAWIEEGDAAGLPYSGEEWGFFLGGAAVPDVKPGDRVYIVAHNRLRGYAPLTRLNRNPTALCRRGGAVAVTIPIQVPGFQGFKYRWWDRGLEVAYPTWKTDNVDANPGRRRGQQDGRGTRLWDPPQRGAGAMPALPPGMKK